MRLAVSARRPAFRAADDSQLNYASASAPPLTTRTRSTQHAALTSHRPPCLHLISHQDLIILKCMYFIRVYARCISPETRPRRQETAQRGQGNVVWLSFNRGSPEERRPRRERSAERRREGDGGESANGDALIPGKGARRYFRRRREAAGYFRRRRGAHPSPDPCLPPPERCGKCVFVSGCCGRVATWVRQGGVLACALPCPGTSTWPARSPVLDSPSVFSLLIIYPLTGVRHPPLLRRKAVKKR